MTLATPYFTHVYRASITSERPGKVPYLVMRFEIAADSVAHAESIVDAFVADKHKALAARGYKVKIKRIVRDHTEAVILVG